MPIGNSAGFVLLLLDWNQLCLKPNKAWWQQSLLFWDNLFLVVTVSQIPEMFQITYRQNCAVKTQTGRGVPSTVTRSQGCAPLCSHPRPATFSPTAVVCGLLTHTLSQSGSLLKLRLSGNFLLEIIDFNSR